MDDSTPPADSLSGQLGRLRTGDEDARDELVRRYQSRLERLARRMLGDFPVVRRWEQTGDVLQNAMLRFLRALESVKPESERQFLALAALQIRRELIDLARRCRGPHSPMANHASWQAGPDESSPRSPEAADETLEPGRLAEWCDLHEQIARLPSEEREVCELLWYHEVTQAEAARLLDVSERTVKRRWQAVRLKLHELIIGDHG